MQLLCVVEHMVILLFSYVIAAVPETLGKRAGIVQPAISVLWPPVDNWILASPLMPVLCRGCLSSC